MLFDIVVVVTGYMRRNPMLPKDKDPDKLTNASWNPEPLNS